MTSETPLVAIVTGGSNGIGAAIATRLSSDGLTVVIVDIDANNGERTAARLNSPNVPALFVKTNVTQMRDVDAAVKRVIDEFGRVDVLVNNAGFNSYFDAITMNEQDWDGVFAVGLKAVWLASRAVLPHFQSARCGSIVNVSSIHANMTTAGMFPYAAAKAGVEGLTRSLALDYAPYGVRVNAVAPGWTRTVLVDDWLARQDDPAAAEAQILGAHPLGYIAEPEDIAAVVAFLARPESRAVTGAVWAIDCGLSARLAV